MSKSLKSTRDLPPVSDLEDYFSYDEHTGKLSTKRGPVGFVDKGYVKVRYFRHQLMAHRVAWKMFYGTEPDVIDHINGDKQDNRIANLRSCTHGENMAYARTPKRVNGLPTGVSKAPSGRYQARIGSGQSFVYLGSFDTVEEAAHARLEAIKKRPLVRALVSRPKQISEGTSAGEDRSRRSGG